MEDGDAKCRWIEEAMERAVMQVRLNLSLYTEKCQNHSSVDGIYPQCENVQWTCGFWPGEVWLAYECTGEQAFLDSARTLVKSFEERIRDKIEVDHHDMGFLYTPSCVAAWRLTGDEEARAAAVLAADQLVSRFQEKGQFLQAWGKMGAPENYRYIIDCLLNLPLLYWASETTGDGHYADIARRHTATCMANSFRRDGSTFHTFFMKPDGTPDHGETCQGYRDDSFWARGQAWGVYGSILSYRYTKEQSALDTFRRALAFYMKRLPEDLVPCWDMIFMPEDGEPRDSSSAAIVACGLLEAVRLTGIVTGESEAAEQWIGTSADCQCSRMTEYTNPDRWNGPLTAAEAKEYRQLALRMLSSLVSDYMPENPEPGRGLLLHGTYSKKSPYNTCTPEGVDESTSWGDYFFMEALVRLNRAWNPYW